MNGVIHMLLPSADTLRPACGASFAATCTTSEAVVTCSACSDIVRARLATFERAMEDLSGPAGDQRFGSDSSQRS